MSGESLGGYDAPRLAWLARRRPFARRLYAHRLQPDDVVHAPSEPLEVVGVPTVADDGAVTYVAISYMADGSPWEMPVTLRPMRDADGVRRPPTVLASRPSAVPLHLRDREWVSPSSTRA